MSEDFKTDDKKENLTVLGERCQSLLCKGLYLNWGLPEGERVTGDGHFWCGKNQTTYGPDDKLVGDPECCDISRSCYESPDA